MRTCLAILAAAAVLDAGRAAAAEITLERAAPLSEAALANVRGGFIDVAGVEFSFGVVTQTFVNGQLSLATQLSVISPTDFSRSVVGDGAPAGSSAPSSPGADGLTTVFQNIDASQIVNVVTTSANNQIIRQNTAVALTLKDFHQNQADFALQDTISKLNRAMGSSMQMSY